MKKNSTSDPVPTHAYTVCLKQINLSLTQDYSTNKFKNMLKDDIVHIQNKYSLILDFNVFKNLIFHLHVKTLNGATTVCVLI